MFRKLPSLDELLHQPELGFLVEREGHPAAADAARTVLARLREEISAEHLDSAAVDLALAGLPQAIERQLQHSLGYSLRPVINATGVILHTNLGRAPLSSSAIEHIKEISTCYSNLELDLARGERGQRDVHVDRFFRKLLHQEVGGEGTRARDISTIVVNNNAAAVLLTLNTLAEGGEVVVSRGELVEIGGSFRIPDVMAKSGAILREVGTTNRTRLADFERAINERTRLLLRVHRSNFQITGFTEQPALEELVALSQRRGIPLVEDLGSGALFDLQSVGIGNEPGVLNSLRAGVDVVTYSGDKLLGGPQAGIISGRSDVVTRMRSNSMFRALRVDKLIYAALEATLLSYVKHDHDSIPAIRMMRLSMEEIGQRAHLLAQNLESSNVSAEVIDGESVIGGGAAPSAVLPTRLLAVSAKGLSADDMAARLRAFNPSIIARVEEGRVLLDLRTVFPEQDDYIVQALRNLAD
ncbi:MAG: L-seryl-tRNA(Sec) selenium transferase [Acidobacteria bacterium]|nr:MAG: L-seryl-tRNA(Sec) selenium transferase [Acidobacteriota bacterium]